MLDNCKSEQKSVWKQTRHQIFCSIVVIPVTDFAVGWYVWTTSTFHVSMICSIIILCNILYTLFWQEQYSNLRFHLYKGHWYKLYQKFYPVVKAHFIFLLIYINKVADCLFVRNIFLYYCHDYPSLSSNFDHQGENNQLNHLLLCHNYPYLSSIF